MLYRLLSGSPDFTLNGQVPPVTGSLAPADLTQLMDDFTQVAVTAGGHQVNYTALEDHLQATRQDFYAGLRALDLAALVHRDQSLAFWINLYNILVLDAVLTFKVTRSVIGLSQGLLRFFAKAAYMVGKQRFSADDIENGVLRQNRGHFLARKAQFPAGDPRLAWVLRPMDVRIHFALHCASQSCPPLRVYEGSRLSDQLDLATQAFVDAETYADVVNGTLELSTIFHWYQVDFDAKGGAAKFVLGHLGASDPRHIWLQDHLEDVQIRFRQYNWGLNAARTDAPAFP